jgi:hypothetical protein
MLHRNTCLFLCLLAPVLNAQKFYTHVGDIGPTHAVIAWGTTTGSNTIGRTSRSHGKATVKFGDREIVAAERNWVLIENLQPDTEYSYEVTLKGNKIGSAKVRTWPEQSDRLRFFVIGDFGSGDSVQARVAAAMWKEFQRLNGNDPVRFVITTGDNIYGRLGFTLRYRDTGDEDEEWDSKYFKPYEPLIARIPVYPSLGNHDGNETEGRGDLAAYLDNFSFPSPQPARYYRFSYGGLADFFALDTTTNTEEGPPRPIFLKNGDQHKWLEKNLSESRTRWKIPYMHHPPFNAGPRHPAVAQELGHFLDLFKEHKVRVAFSGHEHNFQYSKTNGATGGIRYVISGAGGELRDNDVKSSMDRAQIEGWAARAHFLSVEIEGNEMRITPIAAEAIEVVDRTGRKLETPLKVTAP